MYCIKEKYKLQCKNYVNENIDEGAVERIAAYRMTLTSFSSYEVKAKLMSSVQTTMVEKHLIY